MTSGDARRRVLVVGPMPPTKGGVTTFMLNLMGSHLAGRFAFIPFTTSRPPKKGVLDNWGYAAMFRGGPVRVVQGVLITLWHVIVYPFVLLSRRVQIVQIQASDYQAFWESAVYVVMARVLGRRVSLRIGGAFDHFYDGSRPGIRRMIDWILGLPHLVVAQSDFARGYIERAGRKGPIVVLPNWVRDSLVGYVERPVRTECVFLFMVGSDARRKGLDVVLDAARLLEERGAGGIRLHLIAAPEAVSDRIAQAGLSIVSRIEGFIPHERSTQAMREADVLLLPSFGEGFPNTLVEAMACGLPSIATPVGAVPAMVADGGAELVPVGDAAALADAMARFAADADLRRRQGLQAFATVKARYTADAALRGLEAAYDAMAGA
jgi:glycosyltransferase involved in cell wall biosynthesis